MKTNEYHEPVMVHEAIESLHIEKGKKYIDATLGSGGHSLEIIKNGGFVFGIEADPEILEIAKERLGSLGGSYQLALGNFRNIDTIAKKYGFKNVSGIIFDLGVNNIQLTSTTRGFSFENPDASLDMRLDALSQSVKGSDLLNAFREDQLRSLFEETLDFGSAKWLTKRVLKARAISPIVSVGDFLKVCEGLWRKPGLNTATLPFLALRIAVNSELDNLKEVLPKAYGLLAKGGRLVVISFHSREDGLVKHIFHEFGGKILTRKPTKPGKDEITKNLRSRSAKMRVIEKI